MKRGLAAKRTAFFFCLWFLVSGLLLAASGCTRATYPKEQVKESVIKVCKKEYGVDVKVETIGKTIAIYLPLSNLLDFNFALTKEATETINNVIFSAARVALSTDAKFDFYCVIAHDTRIPEIQIVIIKSVEDVKRVFASDISRGEYSKRMLIDLRLNPQAQKERSLKEIFKRMKLDLNTQNEMMDEFFRAAPAALGEIGYWGGRFYIKDITLPEFMAEQIASRVKIEARENKALSEVLNVKSASGSYVIAAPERRYFRIEVFAEPRLLKYVTGEELSKAIFTAAFKVAEQVTRGYHFTDFSYVEVIDSRTSRRMRVTASRLKEFRSRKVKIDDVLPTEMF